MLDELTYNNQHYATDLAREMASLALGLACQRSPEAVAAIERRMEIEPCSLVGALGLAGEAGLGALTRLLSHRNRHLRYAAVSALRDLGTAARPAVPAILLSLASDPWAFDVDDCIQAALKRIGVDDAVLDRIAAAAEGQP